MASLRVAAGAYRPGLDSQRCNPAVPMNMSVGRYGWVPCGFQNIAGPTSVLMSFQSDMEQHRGIINRRKSAVEIRFTPAARNLRIRAGTLFRGDTISASIATTTKGKSALLKKWLFPFEKSHLPSDLHPLILGKSFLISFAFSAPPSSNIFSKKPSRIKAISPVPRAVCLKTIALYDK